MADKRKVNEYFKAREKVKKIMREMLKPKYKWTKTRISKFKKAFKEYEQKYTEHEELCKTER